MEDMTIICKDCGQEFVWTAGEREFYESKGIEKPIYCMICRGKYKARQEQMEKYQKKTEE